MISAKMEALVKNGSAIRAMFEDGKIMSERYGRENIFDFSLGNPSIAPPESVKKAIINIVNTEPETLIHGYMSNSGYDEVRSLIASKLNKKYGLNLSENNIIMTVGAAGGLNTVFKTILEPGDEVVLTAPYFGEYNNYIANFDGVPVVISPKTDNFGINFEELENKITKKTRAMIINSPCNPTGAIYDDKDITRLSNILDKKQKEYGKPIYLISDEPYREIVFDGTEIPYILNYYENSFVCYSFSKSLSIPGERIGYITVSEKIDGFSEMTEALSVANRILGYVNAPSLFQKVIARCFDDTSDISVYKENKNILYNGLTKMGYKCVEPRGTFYMFPKCFIADDKEFCRKAKDYRLIIVPGSTFACSGYFRISYCVDKEVALNSLESFKMLADYYGINTEQ